jgi:hypothetical protein
MRDPYTDHVLRIAGIDPGDPYGTAGALPASTEQAADPYAWRWGNPEQPRLAPPAPAYLVPPYAAPPQRPPVCFDWTTVAFASGLAGLIGFLLGGRRG